MDVTESAICSIFVPSGASAPYVNAPEVASAETEPQSDVPHGTRRRDSRKSPSCLGSIGSRTSASIVALATVAPGVGVPLGTWADSGIRAF